MFFKHNADALWVPDLESDDLQAVDKAVEHRDKDGETELVNEFSDNASCPVVRATVKHRT